MKLVIRDNSSYSKDRLTLYAWEPIYETAEGRITGRANIVAPVGEHEVVSRFEQGARCQWRREWATITVDGVVYGKPIDDPDVKKLLQ